MLIGRRRWELLDPSWLEVAAALVLQICLIKPAVPLTHLQISPGLLQLHVSPHHLLLGHLSLSKTLLGLVNDWKDSKTSQLDLFISLIGLI